MTSDVNKIKKTTGNSIGKLYVSRDETKKNIEEYKLTKDEESILDLDGYNLHLYPDDENLTKRNSEFI